MDMLITDIEGVSQTANRIGDVILVLGVMAILQSLLFKLFRDRIDSRPLLEQLFSILFGNIVRKLNRDDRSSAALSVRGYLLFITGLPLIWFGIYGAKQLGVQYLGHESVIDTILLLLTLSPFSALFLSLAIAKDGAKDGLKPEIKNAYYRSFARSTYSNLIHLDEFGLRREAIKMNVLAFSFWFLAPVLLFIALGGYGAATYCFLLTLSNLSGRSNPFSAFSYMFYVPVFMVQLATIVLGAFAVLFASLVTPSASFASAFKGMRAHHIRSFDGGACLAIKAYALNLTLGGPYQDKDGTAVNTKWVGPKSATAKAEKKDVYRSVYLMGGAYFIVVSALFLSLYLSL